MRSRMHGLLAAGTLCLLASTSAFAQDPAARCESSKLGTSAKYVQCRLKAEAKAVRAATSPDYSRCSLGKFTAAETKAAGMCPTSNDSTSVGDYLDQCTGRLATWLATGSGLPACGDALADYGETCDGADLNGKTCATEASSTPYGTLACNGTCDGFDTSGCKSRFTDNGDGTVTDNSTKLMWEKKTTAVDSGEDYSNPNDVDNYYTWTAGTTAPNGTVFTDFLDKLNGMSGCYAGHCDWRLPTREELQGIIDLDAPGCGSGSPCIDAVFGPTNGWRFYWSSTTLDLDALYAWYGDFYVPGTSQDFKTASFFVRAVRAGS